MYKIGIIGYGYWGPNLLRNFMETTNATVTMVSDLRPERLAQAALRYPTLRTTLRAQDLITDPDVDAVVIATPVSTHYELARAALMAGKHVFVEKPMAATSQQCRELIELAAQKRRILQVDHTFVYTGAVRKIAELVADGRIGEIYYYDSTRVNLGLFQHDVNVVWDLAVHDLSIMDYVLPYKPIAVSATGMSHVPAQPENVAYLTLFFDNSLIAHINVNWLAPVKIRRTLIGGSQQMIVYDELEPSEKIKIYDRGITLQKPQTEDVYQLLVGYRAGDMWAPQIDLTEALRVEAAHFVTCMADGVAPRTDGHAGWRVVRVLEAATQSIQQKGQIVPLATL